MSCQVSRARSNIFHARTRVLLYTERFHFFKRYRLRGLRHVVFYAPPKNAEFYGDMLRMVCQPVHDAHHAGHSTSLAMFSRFDHLELERIVGSTRAERMVHSRDDAEACSDTFIFC